jgi:hypothetical protein
MEEITGGISSAEFTYVNNGVSPLFPFTVTVNFPEPAFGGMVTLSSVEDAETTVQAIVLSSTMLLTAFELKPVPEIVTTVALGPLEGDIPEITRPGSLSSSDELHAEKTKKLANAIDRSFQ